MDDFVELLDARLVGFVELSNGIMDGAGEIGLVLGFDVELDMGLA